MPARFSFFRPKRPRVPDRRPGPGFYQAYGGKKYWLATRKRILVRDNWQCQRCGRVCATPGEAQVDHRKPKSEGGDDSDGNLWVLCRVCHGMKTRSEQLGAGLGPIQGQ